MRLALFCTKFPNAQLQLHLRANFPLIVAVCEPISFSLALSNFIQLTFVLSSSLWLTHRLTLALSCALWGSIWLPLALCGTNWLCLCLSLAITGSLWLSVAHTLAPIGPLCHPLAVSGLLLLSNFSYYSPCWLSAPLPQWRTLFRCGQKKK